MSIVRNRAVLAPLTAIALFLGSILVFGIALTRDTVDMASVFMGLIVALRLLPDAWDRFKRGGDEPGWQLLMGNVLWLFGWVFFCSWTYIARNAEDYGVDISDDVVGFFAATFKLWVLGGIILSHFATQQPSPFIMAPSKLYYTTAGVAAGILIGFGAAKIFAG